MSDREDVLTKVLGELLGSLTFTGLASMLRVVADELERRDRK